MIGDVEARRAAPWALATAATLLYLGTNSFWNNFDGVACAIAVDLGDLKHLAHGNHLAYGGVGLVFDRLWRLFGYQGPALLPLQALNKFLGGAAVGVFCSLLLRLGVPLWTAVAGAAALALSHAWWFWSLEAQVYPLGALFLMLAAREGLAEKPRPVALGLAHAGAMLGHAGHVMWAPCALYLLWGKPGGRARRLAAYVGVGSAAVIAAYAAAAVFMVKPASLEDARLWLLGSAALSPDRSWRWQGGYSLDSLASWAGLSGRIFANPGDWAGPARLAGWALSWLPVAAGAFALARVPRRIALACLLWLAGYAALFSSWNPAVIVYRITDLAPVWLVLALAAGRARGLAAGLAGWALVGGLYNWAYGIKPQLDPRNNEPYQEALWVGSRIPEDAWICATSNGEVYFPYFGHRKPLILHYYDGNPGALAARVDAAAAAGQPVFVTEHTLVIAPSAPALRAYGLREHARQDGRVLYRLARPSKSGTR